MTPHYITLHYITSYYTISHCTTSQYIASHHNTLHYNTLQYITSHSSDSSSWVVGGRERGGLDAERGGSSRRARAPRRARRRRAKKVREREGAAVSSDAILMRPRRPSATTRLGEHERLHYIILHHITSHYIILHHITSHYITVHHITSHRSTRLGEHAGVGRAARASRRDHTPPSAALSGGERKRGAPSSDAPRRRLSHRGRRQHERRAVALLISRHSERLHFTVHCTTASAPFGTN